jgi:hypothetical protein
VRRAPQWPDEAAELRCIFLLIGKNFQPERPGSLNPSLFSEQKMATAIQCVGTLIP